MLTILFATSTAALFGVADFLGGVASRRESPFAVTAVSHALGALLLAIAVAVLGGLVTRGALGFGAFAGLSGGLGVVALYAALACGRMSIVAPTTAAVSGSLPAAFDLLRGSHVGPFGLLGMGLALVAVIVVSSAPHEDDDGGRIKPQRALALSLLAGTGFAGSFIAFSFTPAATGLWPVLTARVTSLVLVGAIALVQRRGRPLAAGVLAPALSAGVLDTLANVCMLNAVRRGPLAVASVLAALYPVVTVLLARVVLGERLRVVQRAGVAMALVAVVLTALR